MVAADPPVREPDATPDVGTPVYDAVVQELGDPIQRGEAFDQSLVDLDTYIDETLHGQNGQNGAAE